MSDQSDHHSLYVEWGSFKAAAKGRFAMVAVILIVMLFLGFEALIYSGLLTLPKWH